MPVKFTKDGMPVKLKIPKSFGQCADLLFDLKEARLAAQKVVDAIAEQESAIKNHLIDNIPKGDRGAIGAHHKVTILTDEVPRISDDAKFYAYVKKHDAFDMLQRRLNDKAVRDRMEAQKPKRIKDPKTGEVREVYQPLPGTEMFGIVKVSLTKVK